MNELTWSFVVGLDTGESGPIFEVLYRQEILQQIGYPEGIDVVPEGLLIEGCAQSAGLSLFLDDPQFHSLPVLAKVNRAQFFAPCPVNRALRIDPTQTHISESGAQFECTALDPTTEKTVSKCEFLLGFLPFDQIPNGGQDAKTGLKNFLEGLQ